LLLNLPIPSFLIVNCVLFHLSSNKTVYPEPTIAPTQIKTAESSSSWVVAVIGVVCAVVVLSAIGLITWCVIKRRRNIAGGQRESTAEEQPVAEPPLCEPYFEEVPEAQVVYVLPAPVAPSAPDYNSKHNIEP
jgi:flagellar basal body-associated protein FliL